MKLKYVEAYMDMAERFGLTSEATRLKVGALIVKNDSVISLGVNGTPSGWPSNVCENSTTGQTEWFVRHAEQSALDKLVKSHESSVGASMFISHSPCMMCSIRIVEAGIKEVFYRHSYRCNDGIIYLQDKGVRVYQV